MNISITKNHDIELDKKELEGIKTATEFMVFLENMAFLFTRLCNYSDKLELTQEQKRYRLNMERNLGYYLLRRSDHE